MPERTSTPRFRLDGPAKQREIASKGGSSVPPKKRPFSQNHQFAAEAGRKGGEHSHGGNQFRNASSSRPTQEFAARTQQSRSQAPVRLQHLAGEIEAAADQDTRAAAPAARGSRPARPALSAPAGDAAGRRDDRLHRHRRCWPGSATAQSVAAQRQQRAQELGGVLRLLHADDQMHRPIRPAGEVLGQRRAGAGIVAAVEPQLPVRRQQRRQLPAQPLQSGRPFRRAMPPRDRRRRQPSARGAQRGDGDAGVVELKQPGSDGGGRSSAPARRRSETRRRLASIVPVAAAQPAPARRHARPPPAAPRATSCGCAPIATGHAGLHDAGLLRRRSPPACRRATRDDPSRSR